MHNITSSKVLFITTKNLDYIRNTQEINYITGHAASYKIIGSYSSKYAFRLCCVFFHLFFLSAKKYDVIFIGFAPQLVLPFFSRKFKKKYIVEDFFISLYDTFVDDRKKIKANSILAKLLFFLDKKTLFLADKIICDTKAHSKYFENLFSVPKEKFIPFYLEADSKVYYPHNATRPASLTDKKIILYFGSILPLQGIEYILDAFRKLSSCKELHFLCIGPINEKNLPFSKPISFNIQYIDWLSQKDLSDYIAMSDLCIAGHFHPTIQKAQNTIPGKAYIYEALKKPMILGDTPANHELFVPDENHIFVETGNASAISNAILNFFT